VLQAVASNLTNVLLDSSGTFSDLILQQRWPSVADHLECWLTLAIVGAFTSGLPVAASRNRIAASEMFGSEVVRIIFALSDNSFKHLTFNAPWADEDRKAWESSRLRGDFQGSEIALGTLDHVEA
jgi:hypothetical protein